MRVTAREECARMIGDVKILQRKVVLADGRNGPVPASAKYLSLVHFSYF
jgi:hypothetical protein